jgi:hypothetical protein
MAHVVSLFASSAHTRPAVIPNAMVYGLIVKDEYEEFKDVKLPEVQTDWEGLNSYGFANARGGNLFLALESTHLLPCLFVPDLICASLSNFGHATCLSRGVARSDGMCRAGGRVLLLLSLASFSHKISVVAHPLQLHPGGEAHISSKAGHQRVLLLLQRLDVPLLSLSVLGRL